MAFFSSQFILSMSLFSSIHHHRLGSNNLEVPTGEKTKPMTAKMRAAATSSADDNIVCFGGE